MSEKLEAALRYARAGYRLIPLNNNEKNPIARAWPATATSDEDVIRSWFDFNEPNIGIATGWYERFNCALVAVDLDRHGEDGVATWSTLLDQHGAHEKTLMSRTASDGRHLLFRSPHRLRRRIGKIGPGVDIIAERSFIVAPPSTTSNGSYELIGSIRRIDELAQLPEWVADACEHFVERQADAKSTKIQHLDSDLALEQAIEWLKNKPEVNEGRRDIEGFQAACMMRDFGLSPATAERMLLEHWRCSPTLDHEIVMQKVASAYRNARNTLGTASLQAFAESPLPTALGLTAFTDFNELSLPAREWIIRGHAAARYLGLLFASPGMGKSTLAVAIAIAIVTGRSDILDLEVLGRFPVVMWNNEDDMDEMRRRLLACMKHFNVKPEDMLINGRPGLYLQSGQIRKLLIAVKGGPDGQRVVPQMVDELVAELQAVGARVLIVDPLAEIHGLDENDNMQMAAVAALLRTIAQRADVYVLTIHHTRKLPAGSSEGHAGNMDSGRGASAITGVARFVFTLFGLSQKDAKKWGIAEEERHLYIRFDGAKANLALVTGKPKFFVRRSVDVNGESVGVLAPVDLKPQFEPSEDSAMIRDIVSVIEGAGLEAMAPPVRARVAREKGTAPAHAMGAKTALAALRAAFPMYAEIRDNTFAKRFASLFEGDEHEADGWFIGGWKNPQNDKAQRVIYLRPVENAEPDNSEDIFG